MLGGSLALVYSLGIITPHCKVQHKHNVSLGNAQEAFYSCKMIQVRVQNTDMHNAWEWHGLSVSFITLPSWVRAKTFSRSAELLEWGLNMHFCKKRGQESQQGKKWEHLSERQWKGNSCQLLLEAAGASPKLCRAAWLPFTMCTENTQLSCYSCNNSCTKFM